MASASQVLGLGCYIEGSRALDIVQFEELGLNGKKKNTQTEGFSQAVRSFDLKVKDGKRTTVTPKYIDRVPSKTLQ